MTSGCACEVSTVVAPSPPRAGERAASTEQAASPSPTLPRKRGRGSNRPAHLTCDCRGLDSHSPARPSANERVQAANRANAARSTGPRTRAGKQRSARNALRHGLNQPVLADPGIAAEAADLARRIAGEDATAPRCRAPHRRGAGRHQAHPPRARADHGRRVRRRRRHHRPADAARPLRAAGAVAAEIRNPGVRFPGAPGRAAATPQSLGRGRRCREAGRALAERTRFRRDTRPVGRGRRRCEAAWSLAEQTRFRPGTPSARCRCRRRSPRNPPERSRCRRRACAHVCLARACEFDYRPRRSPIAAASSTFRHAPSVPRCAPGSIARWPCSIPAASPW